MNPNTKLSKLLKYLYKNRDRKVTAREITENTGIPSVTSYFNRVSNHVQKEMIDGKMRYWIKPYDLNYIKRKLEETYG